jgi:quercetin dioxygenase-like cupin family protein
MAYITKISSNEPEHDELHTPYIGTDREFVGDVTAKRLIWAGDSPDVELLAVWFSAGARTRAHIHDADQALHVMEGTCAYGDENGVTLVPAGNVFLVPKGTWHWHGATPSAPMMHISIRKIGNSTNWDVEERDWVGQYARMRDER